MHKISPQSVQAAQEHAKQSLEHGKSIEEVGERLLLNDPDEQQVGQRIELYGKTIQKQAQESLEKAQELKDNPSTEVFVDAVQAHIDAAQKHVEAVREFQKVQTHLPE